MSRVCDYIGLIVLRFTKVDVKKLTFDLVVIDELNRKLKPPYIYVYRCAVRHRIRLSTRSILLLNRCENQTHIRGVLILLTDCVILNCALIFSILQ